LTLIKIVIKSSIEVFINKFPAHYKYDTTNLYILKLNFPPPLTSFDFCVFFQARSERPSERQRNPAPRQGDWCAGEVGAATAAVH